MKRSPALIELSREHHTALSLAQRARRAAASGDREAIAAMAATLRERFDAELKPHFEEEEVRLLPVLAAAGESELVSRTLADHVELARFVAQLASPDAATLLAFADCLTAHVRFEERELFLAAERHSESL